MSDSSQRDQALARYFGQISAIPGWFLELDARLLAAVDSGQREHGIRGDLFEIGAYLGKSAILFGALAMSEDTLTVCDLFEGEALTGENAAEQGQYYGSYARGRFEENYAAFHGAPPDILAMSSSLIDRETYRDRIRLMHIDGSHTYSLVRSDIEMSRGFLVEGGVVAIDDWCQTVSPGSAAAVWESLVGGELQGICLTPQKLYATWTPEAWPVHDCFDVWIRGQPTVTLVEHEIFGRRLPLVLGTGEVPRNTIDRPINRLRRGLARRLLPPN